jgi:glycosyltransferase involved in cell wall biosynthesis
VRILGTHGVPAAYGGFETAAENVGLHLAEQGWRVVVYCQVDGRRPTYEDTWHGLERVNISVDTPGWRGTSLFDLHSVRHASRFRDLCLVFGYNTAIFNVAQRLRGIPLIVNMDGIEWSRARWGPARQAILYVNERIAAVAGNHLIADHPHIETYLRSRAPARKISMITYGAHEVLDAPTAPLVSLGVEPGRFLSLVCRPIPENSILELVRGFSARRRDHRLLVVGPYQPDEDPYHREVMDAASEEVVFAGPVFEPDVLRSVRFHSAMYLHGHTVGGTNPSLVEAMGAGNPVLAHDNVYNRWTAGDGAAYFTTSTEVDEHLARILGSPDELGRMGRASRERYRAEFTWDRVAGEYQKLLAEFLPQDGVRARTRLGKRGSSW